MVVDVPEPPAPFTLQRMSFEVTSVTGELLGGGRMLTNWAPVTPFTISLSNMSTHHDESLYEVLLEGLTVAKRNSYGEYG